MMESRPRSVLAAFQEHLQLASTKCGSLMEQLNIVRKKVEGKEAAINGSDPFSDGFLENVSQKTSIVLQSEELDLLNKKDVLKEQYSILNTNLKRNPRGKTLLSNYQTTTIQPDTSSSQMAIGNAYVERSTGDTNCDINKHLIIRKSSQHSEIVVNKEEVPYINGKTVASNEKEMYSLKPDGATNQKRSEEKLIEETEKISGKSSLNAVARKEKESFNEDVSSEDESTLSSCVSSNNDDQEAKEKEKIFEELLKRLQDNEDKKNVSKNGSSSENSSSSFQKSQKTNKSPKKNSSNSTVNEDIFERKNGDIENLDVGVEFFLPSSATEKFQKMYCENVDEEEKNQAFKDKNMRVTFDDLIVGRPTKNHISGETYTENTSSQNRLPSETSLKNKISPRQSEHQVSHHRQNGKIKEKNGDTWSLLTKSEKLKKQNTILNSSALVNFKVNSPEMNLYKRLNGTPLKKMGGRKEKHKKTTVTNSRLKAKHVSADQNLKSSSNEKNIVTSNISKNIKNESNPPRTVNNTEKNGGKDVTIENKIRQKDNSITNSNNLHKKSETKMIVANLQPKKVIVAKISGNTKVNKIDSVENNFNHKVETKHDNTIDLGPKHQPIKKNHINKVHNPGNSKEKVNSDPKNMISKKNQFVMSEVTGIPKEKLSQTGKNGIAKEKKPDNTKIEYLKKDNMRTLTTAKSFSSKHNPIHEEIPALNTKLKNNNNRVRSNTSAPLVQPKKESNKPKLSSNRKEDNLDIRNLHSFDKSSKTREQSENIKGRNHLARDATYSQSINEMKAHISSFPFILGQSTSKTYNVRAAIQQTMSMIMRSPSETLRRSSFSEMLNVSSKASSLKTSASCTSGRKVCPACVMRVDEEDNDPDNNPIDPWDTEYHSKRFIRCTCMPRNTVNFKTVMNQLLHETSSSFVLPTESYQDSELENGEDNRVNKSLFRRNNNSNKLSKLLHTLLKIRDLLVT